MKGHVRALHRRCRRMLWSKLPLRWLVGLTASAATASLVSGIVTLQVSIRRCDWVVQSRGRSGRYRLMMVRVAVGSTSVQCCEVRWIELIEGCRFCSWLGVDGCK